MPIVSRKGAATSQGFGQFGGAGQNGNLVYVWGGNFFGEMLQGLALYQNSPTLASWLSDYATISRGYAVAGYIKSNGTLWVTGYNYGIAGNSSILPPTIYSPVQVGTATNWASVACGVYNWIAIKTDGTMWACGYNAFGTLGTNDAVSRSSPVQIGVGQTWSKISMGYYDSYGITTSNTLWSWGYNTSGQSGRNTTAVQYAPLQVGSQSDWSEIKCQQYTVLGLRGSSLYVWGEGGNGQIGDGQQISRSSPVQIAGTWTKIASTDYASYGIKTDGTLWAWGNNGYGELGQNNTIARSSPVQVGTATDWSDLANGYYGNIASKTNGSVWVWGYGGSGGLGNSALENVSSPIQVGVYTSPTLIQGCNFNYVIVKQSTGVNYAWGYADYGVVLPQYWGSSSPVLQGVIKKSYSNVIIGYGSFTGITKSGKYYTAVTYPLYGAAGNNTRVTQYSPVLSGYSKVLVTLYNSLALKSDGTIWAWGYNAFGSVGQNDTINYSSPVQIGTATDWTDIYLSQPYCAFAKKSNGTLWAWGNNQTYGMLGLGDTNSRSSPTQVGPDTNWQSLQGGYYAVWAFKGGSLVRWGYNGYGQLGSGDEANYSNPTAIAGSYTKAVSGTEVTILSKADGTLWACGNNTYGSLGTNNTIHRSSPVQIGSDTNWNSFLVTQRAIAATKTNGTLWGWGYNPYGQVGDGTTENRSSPVQLGSATDWTRTAEQPTVAGYVAAAMK